MKEPVDKGTNASVGLAILAVAGAAWALLVLLKLGPMYKAWGPFLLAMGRGLLDPPSPGAFFASMGRHLAVAAWALAFAAACAFTGRPLLRLARLGEGNRFTDACLSACLGWVALGTLWYGLALAGLFYPSLILGSGVALAAAGALFPRLGPSAEYRAALAPFMDRKFLSRLLLFAAPAVVFSSLILVPTHYIDLRQYHAAVPERFLAEHRFATSGTSNAFHLQLTAEMVNTVAEISGYDALFPVISLVPYLAALLYGAAWIAGVGGWKAAGTAVGLCLSLGVFFWSIIAGKNDLACTGLCLVALASQAKRRGPAAAVFWGMAVASKINAVAFAGIAWLWHEGTRSRRRFKYGPDLPWMVTAAVLPCAWFVKEWLMSGDPMWPVFSRWLGGSLWDAKRQQVLELVLYRKENVTELLEKVVMVIRDCAPALAVGLPVILRGARKYPPRLQGLAVMTVVSVLAFAFVVYYEVERLILPVIVFWCFIAAPLFEQAAGAAGRLGGRLGKAAAGRIASGAVVAVLCVAAWAPAARNLALSCNERSVKYLTGKMSFDQYMAIDLATLWETQAKLRLVPGVRRIILINEHAPYRWHGKAITEEFFGRKPSWLLTSEAPDIDRMLIRLRQMNATHIVFNFIVEMAAYPNRGSCGAYSWSDRQLDLYHEFMGRHTQVEVPPEHCDKVVGGYYVYRITRKPVPKPELIHYMPGIQEVVCRILSPMYAGRLQDARKASDEWLKRYPDVGVFHVIGGFLAYVANDWKASAEHYEKPYRYGMVGDFNYGLYGGALNILQRYDEALKVLATARRVYVNQTDVVDLNIAFAYAQMAVKEMKKKNLKKAYEYARAAMDSGPDHTFSVLVMAEAELATGHVDAAEALFRRAQERWATDPQVVDVCRRRLDDIAAARARGGKPEATTDTLLPRPAGGR